MADKITDFSEAMAAYGQRNLLEKDFLRNLEWIEPGLSISYLRRQITGVQKVQEVEQLHDFLTQMVRSQEEESAELKSSTDGSYANDSSPLFRSASVTEKNAGLNRPYTGLMTLLRERVLQRGMHGKSLKYFQLVDIVGEVDDPFKAIDMLIWAKKQHEEKKSK